MMSAHVILILLVPLLAHGAPTPSDRSKDLAKYPWYSSSSGFIVLPPLPGLHHTGQTVGFTGASRPPAYSHPPHDQPQPESTSADAHPNLEHTKHDGNTKVDKITCTLPVGTMYHLPGITCFVLERTFVTKADGGMVITPRGEIISLPAGITVELSNETRLPTDSRIRINDEKDPITQNAAIFSEGTTYLTRSQRPSPAPIPSAVCNILRAEWIVFIPGPQPDIIFLPKGTLVFIASKHAVRLPPIVHLPTGETKIRKFSDDERLRVTNWCGSSFKPERGKESWGEYSCRCFSTNGWNVIDRTGFTKVIQRRVY